MNSAKQLNRSLSLPHVIFYGLGTILGAGIYVLVGKVAFYAGIYAPFSFLLAGLLAAFSALSYAELASRYPVCASESTYVLKAFNAKYLSIIIGGGIIMSGIVSAGVLLHGFAGYLQKFVTIEPWIAILIALILLTSLAIYGIKQSATFIAMITLIEVFGLLMIIWVSREYFLDLPSYLMGAAFNLSLDTGFNIALGSFLAFYAFIGFEDMVNTAEEVKDAKSVLPKAIVITLILSFILYFLVSLSSVLSLTSKELATSSAPLADIFQKTTGMNPVIISLIGLFAIINGVIVQIIMSSRVLYGMSNYGWIPSVFRRVNAKTKTPIFSTIGVCIVIYLFVMNFPIVKLANLTSLLILTIFGIINLALIKIKINESSLPEGIYSIPLAIPVIGFLVNVIIVIGKIYSLM